MRHKLGIVLTAVGIVAGVAFSMQQMQAQSEPVAMYASTPMQLSVSTRSGQALATLEIPAGVTVSVSGAAVLGNAGEKTPTTFTGNVTIRTRPTTEVMKDTGVGTRERMIAAPFRLDVQDAVVVITRQQ